MASLKDKVIIITGSGDEAGIGAAIAQYMVQFQPKLVLTGRDKKRLDRVGELCRNAGLAEDRILLVVADVNKESDLGLLVDETIKSFQRIDVLVNNAGIMAFATVLDTAMEVFDSVMRTNIRSPFHLTKLCLPHLISTKGNVVNISSIIGLSGFTGIAAYSISKAALDQFTKILAMEMAPQGVRVNSVNPGAVRSKLLTNAGMSEENFAQFIESDKKSHPLGRVGDAIEVAKAVVWLASDDSSFTTGQLLLVDGGRITKAH